jgi:hypothetical protein
VLTQCSELFDIGFSLEIARLNRHLGIDQYGWSYSACNGKTRHRNEWQQYGYQGHPKCAKGDIIGCGINFKAGIGGTIFYTRNGVFLGTAVEIMEAGIGPADG